MLIAGVIMLLLGIAAWRDVATRTIPNEVCLGIMLVGIAARLSDGWGALGMSAIAAVVLFVLLLPLHGRGLLGGGDLKLMAALAFGLSPLASYQMFCTVVLAGGVLAAAYIALRHIIGDRKPAVAPVRRRRSLSRRVLAVEFWRIRKRAPLPYGLAIAAGAALVIAHPGV